MKVNIHQLSMALFFYMPQYLDLDTGRIYSMPLQRAKIESLPNKRLLPLYSEAPIHQRYLLEARDQHGIEHGSWFDEYPTFDLVPDQPPSIYDSFMKKAHIAVDSFLTPTFPRFDEYLDDFEMEFAKEWCKREGYEWYEE